MGKTIYYNEFDNGLQPCPYCGASPKLLKKKNKVYYECNGDCWASTKAHWDEADARTEWNSLKPREENSEYLECRYIDASELLEIAKDGCHPDFEQSLADLTSLRELIEDTPTAEVVELKNLSPCDVCMYNPPSSGDGKPCCMCPAERERKDKECQK